MLICHPDVPVGKVDDHLRFERYVEPLTELLADPKTRTPMTVGIFGPWGSGKSTLLKQIGEAMDEKHPGKFLRVPFNPWVHRSEPNMLLPLLHCLHDALSSKKSRFTESANRIFDVLARLGADTLLKTMTLNAVDLDRLDKLEKAYLERNKEFQSEMHQLRNTLSALAEDVGKVKAGQPGPRLVFMIDDLDRCQPDEMIGVLESVKLFLDVENVIVILAVDKEVIDRGIEVRYGKFKFADDRATALGAEYLEKIVQLPLTLLPLDRSQITSFVTELGPPGALRDLKDSITELFLPNPRKIKRILNILALTEAIINNGKIDPAPDLALIARLVILQVQDGELYARIARRPELLEALQDYYTAIEQKRVAKFDQFGDRAEEYEKFCKANHRPGSYLAALFKGAPFAPALAEKDGLTRYLTLLGA